MSFIKSLFVSKHGDSSKSSNLDLISPVDIGHRVKQVVELLNEDFMNEPHVYDYADLIKFTTKSDYVRRYLERREYNVQEAFVMMRETLVWRKQNGLSTMTPLSFPIEFYTIGALFNYNYDVDGNSILIVRCRVYRTIPEMREAFELLTAYRMFEADERGAENDKGWTFLFDVTGTGFLQYNVNLMSWLISTLVNYFPMGLKKILIYNTPFLFRPFVGLVLTFVPKEWRYLIHFVNSQESLHHHIARESLPDFLGGLSLRSYRQPPEGARNVEIMAKERYNMSKETVDKIKVHFEKYFTE